MCCATEALSVRNVGPASKYGLMIGRDKRYFARSGNSQVSILFESVVLPNPNRKLASEVGCCILASIGR